MKRKTKAQRESNAKAALRSRVPDIALFGAKIVAAQEGAPAVTVSGINPPPEIKP